MDNRHTVAEHLTALDATFLELEQLDEGAHMHIGGVMLFEPGAGGGAPPTDRICEELERRLLHLPRYRQRLSTPRTGGLRWPSWESDPAFDIRNHVIEAGLPGAAGVDELREWAGEYFSGRLDRRRPLWEMAVLELADGRWAMVNKTHHCMVDGVGSVDIVQSLLDASPDAAPGDAVPGAEDEGGAGADPGGPLAAPRRLLLGAVHGGIGLARRAVETAEGLAGVGRHPAAAASSAAARSRAVAEFLVRDEVIAAPSCSLNGPIGAKRRIAVLQVPLEDLKAIKGRLGGTVNDVVLAATAGGLRALLLHRGEEPPERGLRAMVPVNLRTAAEQLALGNRITSLFVHIPVAVADPLARYERQREEAESLKSGSQASASSDIIGLTALAPPVIHSLLARSLYATRLFNLTITNVPGPQLPLYSFGCRLQEVWPLVPLAAEHGVGLAVFSYDGSLFFCLNGDRDTLPDIEVLRRGIEDALQELLDLAGVTALS